MATPLVGLADESYHGGSQVITSNNLPPYYFWAVANSSHLISMTFSLIGMVQNY